MQTSSAPVAKDLVLVGGGHSHVAVLRRFGMRPLPGLRLTLITRDIHTPYSGMLPGYVAGHYDFDECHIDLGPLARFAGARLYHGEVEALDLEQRSVRVAGRPPVAFDLLSINTGSRPGTMQVPGAAEHTLPVKPIDRFLEGWERLIDRVAASQGRFRVAVVGGGAGGVELALATRYRLRRLLAEHGDDPNRLEYLLLTQGPEILPTHSPGVRRRFQRVLGERGIRVLTGHTVVEVREGTVRADGRPEVNADAVLWVTSASAPAWPRESGLAVDAAGFIRVDDRLQSLSHPGVFAAGDVATLPDPRPKSGVFAVRQGPVLTDNLRRAATGRPLRPYRAQRRFLGLISTGDRYAVASRGAWSMEGAWLWRLKDRIDRRFMERYNNLPQMDETKGPELASGVADEQAIRELSTLAMRCGGCGAKVGSTVLTRVMQRLPVTRRDDVVLGIDAPDDATVLSVPEGRLLVQSVDYFRAFIDDSYTFGRIAANHALGDLFAMGAEAQSALAIATVPYGRERVVEEALYELLAGALAVLEPAGAVLAGGHSSEGAELAFGLTVNGLVDPDAIWRKGGLQAGDALVLTKPLGTGTLFAADMRGKAKGRWISDAIASMCVSNQQAGDCLRRFGATACTDVTGFGLLGHLLEMTRASNVDAVLEVGAVPLLDGAGETVAAGIVSSLQPQNLRLRRGVADLERAAKHPHFPLLFDPQTAGGLLAGVPAERAAACVDELRRLGYPAAAVIGAIEARGSVAEPVRIAL
ncbi:selenide, water dikinase SelD [Thioalkalivibrio paradoxus]|uniref:Segregation protein B n=1 Tax=Thioalkalivibrio paradoxus ARh 1 TaxID=713585 RepID=W0DLC3_9GAMM|nr:selenide, water dikinase SelD [Thioalkalivibrio paradoxus]AHE97793.1 segregation protein B [Thioalkalivibrio paradoxus ARh 1]